MTGEELAALIEAEIGESEQLQRILDRIQDGSATFTDSELYAAITAEITAKQMRRNVLSLDGREAAFVDITRQRHSDTFTVFSAVQRILDARSGIRIKPQKPPFEEGRAHKIGHALEDKTVPESVIERRAESATENFCRSHHDDCMKYNAEFRDRAGMTSYIIRDGSAKCCDWCADVSGKYTLDSAPAGIWGRHDNCKCSIQYDAKKGGRQLLRGTSKKWEQVAPGAGAGALVVLTEEQARELEARHPVIRFTPRQAEVLQNSVLTNGVKSGTINLGIYSFEDYAANPLLLGLSTPEEKYFGFIDAGYLVKPLGRGNFKGIAFLDGGGYRVFFDDSMQKVLFYHPSERSHHDDAYYKLSEGNFGTHRFNLDGTSKEG